MKFKNTIVCNGVPHVIHMNTVVLASNSKDISKKSTCDGDVSRRIPAGEFLPRNTVKIYLLFFAREYFKSFRC